MPSLASRIGTQLSDRARACLESNFRFLVRDNADNVSLYAGIASQDVTAIDDEKFRDFCASTLDSSFWATWALADAEPCLLLQLRNDLVDECSEQRQRGGELSWPSESRLFIVAADRGIYELNSDREREQPFVFRRPNSNTGSMTFPVLALQGELVVDARSTRVVFLGTECLFNRVYCGRVDRQTRMSHARALIEGEPARAPILQRNEKLNPADATAPRMLASIEYKPHMTALHAEAVVVARPPPPLIDGRFEVDGIELRCSSSSHTHAPAGASAYRLAATARTRVAAVLATL